MKAAELKKILSDWNKDAFKSLGTNVPVNGEGEDTQIVKASIFGGPKRFCGKVSKNDRFPEELLHPKSNDAVAVGAVLDDATSNSGEDLGIVIAVGINYAQFYGRSSTAMVATPEWRRTNMTNRLVSALTFLDRKCIAGDSDEQGKLPPDKFHLVSVNFFPWVTRRRWSNQINLNAIAEALVLHTYGYTHPADQIGKLVTNIGNHAPGTAAGVGAVVAVVFHGAANAVPYLGMETIRSVASSRSLYTNWVFADNLAYGNGIQNAAVMCPCVPINLARKNSHQFVDE